MLGLRSTVILSLVLALINTTTAGSSGKPTLTCNDCFAKVNNCKKVCIDPHHQMCVPSKLM